MIGPGISVPKAIDPNAPAQTVFGEARLESTGRTVASRTVDRLPLSSAGFVSTLVFGLFSPLLALAWIILWIDDPQIAWPLLAVVLLVLAGGMRRLAATSIPVGIDTSDKEPIWKGVGGIAAPVIGSFIGCLVLATLVLGLYWIGPSLP